MIIFLFSLNTAADFFKVISNTILTSGKEIDFLSTEPGSNSLSLKIIMMLLIIAKMFTPIMLDKMSWGKKKDIIDCSHFYR